MSGYTDSLTIAVPMDYIELANHLACLMGESSADISTFGRENYVGHSVIHAVCKPSVTTTLGTLTLPTDPAHVPPEYDRSKAEQARDLIASGVILVAVNVEPHSQLAAWGITAKDVEL